MPNWFNRPGVSPDKQRHPAEKPVAVWEYLLSMTCPPGGVLCDPYMGSGTSIYAGYKYGCARIYGIDINKKAIEIAWTNFIGEETIYA